MATMLRKLGTLTRSKKPKSELWLKIKGQKMKSPYHCVWLPFCETRPDITFTALTTHEATYPHIRLYELSGEDSLSMFVSFLEQLASIPCTMAIVVINTEESYDLDAKFSSGTGDSPVPVVVVKKKTGKALLQQVKRYERNVEASIEGEKEGEGKSETEDKQKEKTKTKQAEKASLASENIGITLPPEAKDDSIHDLEVRVKKEGSYERHSFKFSLGKLHQSTPSISWMALTTSETTFSHIRIYELKEEDSLSYFMATLSSIPAARAMILVNHKSNYELSMRFQSEDQSPPVPLLLVTKETGVELMRLVRESPRDVEARAGMAGSSRPQSLELEKREPLFAGPEMNITQNPKPTVDPSPSPPGLVRNGLKIRIKSETSSGSCRNFDYVAAPFSASLRAIGWVGLTTGEATYPHVRLHEFNEEEDSLSFFMSTMSSITAMMAIILINPENGFTFSKKFQSEDQSPSVPVLMVSRETGTELLRLARENFREVEAMVELSPDAKKRQPISSPSSPLSWAASPQSGSLSPTKGIVKKGLKLRLRSPSQQQYDFDYMSAPFCLSLRTVNWVDLTNAEATYAHIRLHELKEDDSLSFFMTMLASIPATMAVVLINTQNSYDLEKKFHSDEQGSPVPMLVVTKETGQDLLRLVRENSRKIEARVDLSPGARPNFSPALSSPSPLLSPEPGLPRGAHIAKGLHLKVTNQANPENRDFDYAWAMFNQSARALDWVPLTTSETTFQHVRLHELKEDDSLSYFMATLSSIPAARAMILINSDNSLRLSEKFSSEDQSPPVPVLVVTKETGTELLRLVGENPRHVEVKVDVSSVGAAVLGQKTSTHSSWSEFGVSPVASYHKKRKDQTVIKNGLEVHLGRGSESHAFDYGWGAFNQSVRPFQQMRLTLHEVTFPHIRLHKLAQEDSLTFFMSMMASIPATLVIVLINSENNYELSEKFLSEEQSPPVPVLLVTKETGNELLRLLVQENHRDVEAKIHSQDRPALPAMISVTPPVDDDVKGLHVKVGFTGAVMDFDYVPGPFRQEVRDIDWVCVTTAETTYPHVRLHDLKQEDSLPYFMSTMASTPAALAIIFINSESHFRLSEKFQSEDQSPPVPVLVVTKETGRRLLQLVGENPREVYVRVDQLTLPNVIEKGGLQIQLGNEKRLQPINFDYRWAKFNQSPRDINWRPLAQHETTFPHIRLHQLHSQDSLPEFLSMMASIPATMAVILINTENSYQLSEKFESEEQSPPVPVLVVSKETGRELLKLMEDNPREVEARVETALKGLITPSVSSPTSPEQSLRLSIGGNYGAGLVRRGMEVRLPTEETKYYDFAWPPFWNSPQPLQKMGLAKHQVMYTHMQLHELKHGESLTFFLSTLGSMTSARALILVNTYDGFELDKKFHPQGEGPCVPTLVVPRKTGEALLEIVRVYGREAEIQVHCSGNWEEVKDQEPTKDDQDDWDVIQTPLESIRAGDAPSFQSMVESVPTFTAITDGLQVRSQKGGKEKNSKFDYVWAPFCSARQEIDWSKLDLSAQTPKSSRNHVCLHDLKKKDKNMAFYNSLLCSEKVKALVLVNTCESYKISQEFHRKTKMPVLIITSSTGLALTTVVREAKGTAETRVEFGGLGKEIEWLPSVDAAKPAIEKLEWEDSGIPRRSVKTEEPKGKQRTHSEDTIVGEREHRESVETQQKSEPDSRGEEDPVKEAAQVQQEIEQPTTVVDTRPVVMKEEEEEEEQVAGEPGGNSGAQGRAESEREGSGGGRGEGVVMERTEPHPPLPASDKKTGAVSTALNVPGMSEMELEQSIAEFMVIEAPGALRQPSDTKSQHTDTLTDVSLTPVEGRPMLGVPDSLGGPPTMPPPQEMVPYNPGPYTGDMLGANFLEDVSRSGCAVEPGEHIAELLPDSLTEVEWRKPIENGLQIRPAGQEQSTPQYFTYQWSRVTDSAQEMDWITITEQDNCSTQHIRLHQLTQKSDLQLLMTTLDDGSAACLLLVNNKNTYDVDGGFFPPGKIVWPVPIMVVTSETGKKIRSALKGHKNGAEALVEITSVVPKEAEAPRGRVGSNFWKFF